MSVYARISKKSKRLLTKALASLPQTNHRCYLCSCAEEAIQERCPHFDIETYHIGSASLTRAPDYGEIWNPNDKTRVEKP